MYCNILIKDSESLFICYEVIVCLIVEMVSVVEVGNWEVVSMLECESVVYVDVLCCFELYLQFLCVDVECKCMLFVCILEDDVCVCVMVYLCLDCLQKCIDMVCCVIIVSNVYGSMVCY